jgi:hypothetical protein
MIIALIDWGWGCPIHIFSYLHFWQDEGHDHHDHSRNCCKNMLTAIGTCAENNEAFELQEMLGK